MSGAYPSKGIAKKVKGNLVSSDNTALSSTITVDDNNFGILYRLTLSVDVASEADFDNLVANIDCQITIGSTLWHFQLHPRIPEATAGNAFWMDLGPWHLDWGEEGLYSGVKGDDIVFSIGAAGTGIKTQLDYMYSGD